MSKYVRLDEPTGELVPTVKYLNGQPKGYRFDGQKGYFKIGEMPLLDDKNKPLTKFSITPIAFRVFEENLFARGKKEFWIELFFVDAKNAVSSIMFNNSSANSLQNLQRELFYEDLSLCDVKLDISTTDKSNEKGAWKMATFEYTVLDKQEVADLKELEEIIKVHNSDTLTETAVYQVFEGSFFKEFVGKPQPQLAE